jgi:hypothetical protein
LAVSDAVSPPLEDFCGFLIGVTHHGLHLVEGSLVEKGLDGGCVSE